MRSPAPIVFVLLALARAARAQEGGSASPPPSSGAQRLFHDNCAQCHGETGDGQGWTNLDRPARSFKEGGFSFGNTPEALFRTISVGIPGTPMPAFDLLSADDRRALAEYVVTLGPPIEDVSVEETILYVHRRPLVVRGLLPELAEGLPQHPRGLLVGTTDGMSFEYRADDVRLLAVRQGDFVERTDWTGRGGTPLKPLGKVVHLVEGGKPEATFWNGEPGTIEARLAATRVRDSEVELHYRLFDASGRHLASVVESPRGVGASFGAGFARRFTLTGAAQPAQLWLACLRARPEEFVNSGAFMTPDAVIYWSALRREGGLFECVGVRASALDLLLSGSNTGYARLELGPGGRAELEVTTLIAPAWSEDVQARFEEFLGR